MANPCRFSPDSRTATKIAEFYTSLCRPGARVLDIGFGQGFFLESCHRRGIEAVGIDRDTALVRLAGERGLTVQDGDASRLDTWPPGPWGTIVATHLIEHMSPGELRTFLDGCASRLSAGGRLLLSTPNMADWTVASNVFWLDPTHVRPYPPGAVQALLDPKVWDWVKDGYEPVRLGRRRPQVIVNRIRFGSDYGRSGRWYLLSRKA